MSSECVFSESLSVLDNDFFTQKRFKEWYNMLLMFAGEAINSLRDKTGNIDGVLYEINSVLMNEVVYDAMVGLKTIVASENNTVEAPNPFKIASHLGYWFLRHKPIIFRAANNLDVDSIIFPTNVDENERKDIIVDIKHINEVAVSIFLLRYIFKIDDAPVCNKKRFKKVKETGCFYFSSFPDMFYTIYEKLKYHLTYRDISPKTIEHFLEAYTMHPYLPYTCDLWNTEENI